MTVSYEEKRYLSITVRELHQAKRCKSEVLAQLSQTVQNN